MNWSDSAWLNAGLDGELDLERSLQLQSRLASEPAFKAAWERQQALRAAIRRQATVHEAPPALHAAVLKALGHGPEAVPQPTLRAAPVPRRDRRQWLIGAGSAAFASLATVSVMRFESAARAHDEAIGRGLDDAVAGHLRAQLADRLVEVESSNQHQVKPWLSARLSFSPAVPDLSAHGFELVGGRRDVIEGRTVAALVYRRRLHVISAFVEPEAAERGAHLQALRGFNIIDFAHAGMGWRVVSDLNAKELGDFVEMLRGG